MQSDTTGIEPGVVRPWVRVRLCVCVCGSVPSDALVGNRSTLAAMGTAHRTSRLCQESNDRCVNDIAQCSAVAAGRESLSLLVVHHSRQRDNVAAAAHCDCNNGQPEQGRDERAVGRFIFVSVRIFASISNLGFSTSRLRTNKHGALFISPAGLCFWGGLK